MSTNKKSKYKIQYNNKYISNIYFNTFILNNNINFHISDNKTKITKNSEEQLNIPKTSM